MLPVIVVTALDSSVRDTTLFHLQLGIPGAVVVRHEVTARPDSESGTIRRIVADEGGVREDSSTELEHSCLHCATRHDIVPTLRRLAAEHRYSACLLALPRAANPDPMLEELHDAAAKDLAIRLCGVVAGLDPAGVLGDLFGDDLLAERGLELSAADDRAVGETLCQQAEFADVVLADGAHGLARTAAHLLTAPDATCCTALDELDANALLAGTHKLARARRRIDPVDCPSLPPAASGLTIRELVSARPFHPERLYTQIELLGTGPVRSRGCFWLPTRPATVCAWDGSGGQLSIGDAGRWGQREPRTRLLLFGPDPAVLDRAERAFADCLLTDFEAARTDWSTVDDGFEPWLGSYDLRSA